MTKGQLLTQQLVACLDQINPANGYITDLKSVHSNGVPVLDDQALPFALVRIDTDRCTGLAAGQATRERTYEIEVFFNADVQETELVGAHIDVLRALGMGKQAHERTFQGLVDDQDEALFNPPLDGSQFTTVVITVVVTYVQTYY